VERLKSDLKGKMEAKQRATGPPGQAGPRGRAGVPGVPGALPTPLALTSGVGWVAAPQQRMGCGAPISGTTTDSSAQPQLDQWLTQRNKANSARRPTEPQPPQLIHCCRSAGRLARIGAVQVSLEAADCYRL
jgi:hypothetical protein